MKADPLRGPPLPKPATAVVLTWNGVEETAAMLDSWCHHPLPRHLRVVFVDNGSTDHTPDLLMRHPRFEVVLNPDNRGYTRAANQGIALSEGDVLLLNNDTRVIRPDWLHRLQRTAHTNPKNGVVGCRLLGPKGRVMHAGGFIDPITGRGGNITCPYPERRGVIECSFGTFACGYLRREVIDRLGPLDERFFAYCEDTDYCLRARQAGFRVLMDGRVELFHREGGSSAANQFDRTRQRAESARAFMDKWGGHLPGLVVADGAGLDRRSLPL